MRPSGKNPSIPDASSDRWDGYARECRDRAEQARGRGRDQFARTCEEQGKRASQRAEKARNEGR